MVCEVAEAPKAEFDPELLKHYEQAGLQYALCGGVAAPNHSRVAARTSSNLSSSFHCWSRLASKGCSVI
jgi:hypothetical protein